MEHSDPFGLSSEEKKAWFKEATITHRLLEQTDRVIMRAIREHGGFAYALVYGPSGVGKTTMIRQVSQRLNGTIPASRASHFLSERRSSFTPVPLLVLETRPPDGAAFNRADYYRNALVKLGEPFYEHRRLIDIHSEYTGERQTRGRGKAAHFNESPELRDAMEEAMQRHGVRAVILDEAQHLMTIGRGEYGSSLLYVG
jgi:DNA polymerase III delta prime subunit